MKARRHECPHRDAETTDQILLSQWGVPQQSRHLPRAGSGPLARLQPLGVSFGVRMGKHRPPAVSREVAACRVAGGLCF